jgi:putative ABC transport system permease protein
MTSLDVVFAEARQALRSLFKKPSYFILSTLTLSLGIGTCALVFSLIDQAILKPLPYPAPDRIVSIGMQTDAGSTVSAPLFYRAVRGSDALSSTGFVDSHPKGYNVTIGDDSEVIQALRADRGFVETLGAPLSIGRNFNMDEDRQNGPKAAILSYDFWRQKFGGDTGVLNRRMTIEGQAVQIVGVLGPDFAWPDHFDAITALQGDPNDGTLAINQLIVGRLADGVSLSAVNARTEAAIRAAIAAAPMSDEARQAWPHIHIGSFPLAGSVFVSRSGSTLWLFFAAALCVLGVAAVNLANLMLFRAFTRSQDNAVRSALGAPAGRLALPALAEGLAIGLSGAVMGVLVAWVGLRLFGSRVPEEWLRGGPPNLGTSAVIFAVVAGIVVSCFATLPAFVRAFRGRLLAELVGGSRTGMSLAAGRATKILVMVQVAVAVILLSASALFGHSLQRLNSVPMGFQSASVLTFSLSPVKASVPGIADVVIQTRRISDRLLSEAGVASVGVSTNLPTGSQFNLQVKLPSGTPVSTQFRPVTGGYISTFGIPVLEGRNLDDTSDKSGSEATCLVNAQFAREFLGGKGLGQMLTLPGKGDQPPIAMRIVGIVGDTRQMGPAEVPVSTVFVPLAQLPEATWDVVSSFNPLVYAVRLRAGNPASFAGGLARLVIEASPGQPISAVNWMDTVVAATTDQQRLNLLLVGLFSGLALLLASVGLYAVMSMSVASRRQEFGVRAAIGASPRTLLMQVMTEGGKQLAWGLLAGSIVAVALSRLLQRFLYGTSAADPLASLAVVIALSLAGFAACAVPALRASRVPPMQALRNE